MATCSSMLAWKIPWTKEPGGLQLMGSQSQICLSAQTHVYTRRGTKRHDDCQKRARAAEDEAKAGGGNFRALMATSYILTVAAVTGPRVWQELQNYKQRRRPNYASVKIWSCKNPWNHEVITEKPINYFIWFIYSLIWIQGFLQSVPVYQQFSLDRDSK